MKFSKELKAGLIAVFAIVGFFFLYKFTKGKAVFSTDNTFYAKYDNVEGLEQSSAVSINGLKVGQIDKIIPKTDKTGKLYFIVQMSIDDGFAFSKKSTLEIFEPGLMSGKEMRVNIAYGGPLAVDGDTLSGAFKQSMLNNLSSQVGPVKDQLQEVLKRVDSLANSANKVFDDQNRQEIKLLLSNLNRTISAYEGTSGQVNRLLSNNDPRIQRVLENADVAMRSANSAVARYEKLANDIDVQNLNNAITRLDGTVNELNGVILGIKNGEGSLGKLAKDDQLYNNLEQTSRNLNELIIDVKANPKRYVNFSVFGKNASPKEVVTVKE